ncbi:hypothetical protein PHMEG_00036230 [Phytophthora megakarya]|uniref:Uncharacterized protein n=1 Tax=Phytophthora megakarya TaxID=4795 RepID=A0A225UNK2_9STRA|nr:hypothetical protein PHMEG_00036230 [Phytophthora megakarya]
METNEIKWRRARLELYEKLEQSAQDGLNRDAVLASRDLFVFDSSGQASPKKFTFEHEDDAVTVVCAEIPQAAVRQWGEITREILQAFQGEHGTASKLKDVYMSDQRIMHVTLFYTSHPDDLAPRRPDERKSDRLSREISLLRELTAEFDPIRMVPVKVMLAASGAVLMLFQCVPIDKPSGEDRVYAEPKTKNAGSRAEFSVDLMRQTAQEMFPFVSKKSPNAIVHTTLARVMSPDAFDEAALTRVRETCQRISQQLAVTNAHSSTNAFVVNQVWYVDESHFIRPTGHTTTVALGRSNEADT